MTTKANPERVSLEMSRAQAALARSILFGAMADAASALADDAREAADHGELAGEDALGVFRQQVVAVAELLDVMGWSSRGDLGRVVTAERDRRAGVVV